MLLLLLLSPTLCRSLAFSYQHIDLRHHGRTAPRETERNTEKIALASKKKNENHVGNFLVFFSYAQDVLSTSSKPHHHYHHHHTLTNFWPCLFSFSSFLMHMSFMMKTTPISQCLSLLFVRSSRFSRLQYHVYGQGNMSMLVYIYIEMSITAAAVSSPTDTTEQNQFSLIISCRFLF